MASLGLSALWRLVARLSRPLREREELRGLVVLTTTFVLVGAWGFKTAEPEQFKTWTDAIYFTVITLTTVGYGDLSPTRDLTKWMAIGYVILGLTLMGAFLGVVGEIVLEKIQARREGVNEAVGSGPPRGEGP